MQWHTITDNANDNAFDDHRLLRKIDMYRVEIFVLREQLNDRALLPIPFNSDFIVEPGDNDLPAANFGCAMYRNKIAVENAGIFHTHAIHT